MLEILAAALLLALGGCLTVIGVHAVVEGALTLAVNSAKSPEAARARVLATLLILLVAALGLLVAGFVGVPTAIVDQLTRGSFIPESIASPVAWFVSTVLVIMAASSAVVGIQRIWAYANARRQSLEYRSRIAPLLSEGKLTEAIALSRSSAFQGSHIARVALAAFEEYQSSRDQLSAQDLRHTVGQAIEREAAATNLTLQRGLHMLLTIASVAPFIGLLGTVIAILIAFPRMRTGDMNAIVRGIADALWLTAFGLVAAVPAIVSYHWINSTLTALTQDIQSVKDELLQTFVPRRTTDVPGRLE